MNEQEKSNLLTQLEKLSVEEIEGLFNLQNDKGYDLDQEDPTFFVDNQVLITTEDFALMIPVTREVAKRLSELKCKVLFSMKRGDTKAWKVESIENYYGRMLSHHRFYVMIKESVELNN